MGTGPSNAARCHAGHSGRRGAGVASRMAGGWDRPQSKSEEMNGMNSQNDGTKGWMSIPLSGKLCPFWSQVPEATEVSCGGTPGDIRTRGIRDPIPHPAVSRPPGSPSPVRSPLEAPGK